LEIEAEEFIGVKSFKARGKRVTTLCVAKVEELEPTRFPEEPEDDKEPDDNGQENVTPEETDLDPDAGKSQQDVADEMTGQLHLFD
jgi:topoisomerase-4 subunit A